MRIAHGMHIEWVDQEAVILDPRQERLHYLNPIAALLFGLIAEKGFDAAIEEMRSRFGTEDGFDEDIESIIGMMVEEGLLEDD